MIKVYPVTKTAESIENYDVFVNGEKVELNTARVSAYPFNRPWPGHQRQIEQSELINFLSMQADEPFILTVVPKTPSLSVMVRPIDLEANTTVNQDGVITVEVLKPSHFTIEPYGKNNALHVFVDNVKDYGIDKNDPNLLYFGKGEHNVGDLYLKSGQTLFIDEGAVVYATIFALHVENVKILGRGILDNSKNVEKILYEANVDCNDRSVSNEQREHAINILSCKNVEIDGITIRDSLVYNIDAMSSKNVTVNNIKVIGCWRFNSDGVHFSNCSDCSVKNSFLRTYDDCICIRGFANYEYDRFLKDEKEEDLSFVCKNIEVDNCVIWNDWGKSLQLGTETFAKEIFNINFKNCKVIHSMGMALTIWLVDNAFIHDVNFENITVEYDEHMKPMTLQSYDDQKYEYKFDRSFGGRLVDVSISKHFEYSLIQKEEDLGRIDGVNIKNVKLYSMQKPLFHFNGYNMDSSVKNVTLSKIYWNDEPLSNDLFERQTVKNEFAQNIKLLKD